MKNAPFPLEGGSYRVVDGQLVRDDAATGDAAAGTFDPTTFDSPRAQMDSYTPKAAATKKPAVPAKHTED